MYAAINGAQHDIDVLRRVLQFAAVGGRGPGVWKAASLYPADVGHVGLGHEVEPVRRFACFHAGTATVMAPLGHHGADGSIRRRCRANRESLQRSTTYSVVASGARSPDAQGGAVPRIRDTSFRRPG